MKPARANRPKSYRKGFALVVLLVLVTLIVGAGGTAVYFKFSPKPSPSPSPPDYQSPGPVIKPSESPSDETANWKTYTNKERKFQISYPPQFKAYEDSSWGTPVFVIEGQDREVSALHSVLNVSYLSSNYLKKYSEKMGKNYEDSVFADVPNQEKTYLSGVPAKKSVFEEEEFDKPSNTKSFSHTTFAYAVYKDNSYSVLTEIPFRDEIPVFNQILSTFKFLD